MKRAHGPYRHGHKWRIIIRSEDRSQRNRREPQDKPEGVLMVYRVTHVSAGRIGWLPVRVLLFNLRRRPYFPTAQAAHTLEWHALALTARPDADPGVDTVVAEPSTTRPDVDLGGDIRGVAEVGVLCKGLRAMLGQRLLKTSDPAKVTCKRCRAALGLPSL